MNVTSGKLKGKFIEESFLNRKLAATTRLIVRNDNLRKSANARSSGEYCLKRLGILMSFSSLIRIGSTM